jgi:hypothetical protein
MPRPPVTAEPPGGPPRELSEIVEALQQNSLLLERALWSPSVTVTARFKDQKGKNHAYNLEGTFLFRRPQSLRMDLRPGVGDQVMQIGSNDQEYWVWIEPEIKEMKWGRHRYAGWPCSENVSVRPDQLVSALGMGGLPGPEEGFIGPARKYGKSHDILYYLRQEKNGQYVLEREYWVERVPPYMIRLVLYRDSMGRMTMSAMLDDYRPAWEGGPLVPCIASIIWPKEDGKFTMSLGTVKGLPAEKVSPGAFVRPEQKNLPAGIERITQVDTACDSAGDAP